MTTTRVRLLSLALAAALLASPAAIRPSFGDDPDIGGLHPGDLVTEGGLSVTVPPAGESVWADALLAAGGDQLLGVETSSEGTVTVFRSAPEGSDGGEAMESACGDGAYALTGTKWSKRYEWYYKASSTPGGISKDDAEGALRRAGDNITHNHNDCGLSDTISATISYQGSTSKGTNIGSDGGCNAKDGQNVVAFGDLPSAYLGITCWWTKNGSNTESDFKLNKVDYGWYVNKPNNCSGKWGVESSATHEFGHVFGLLSVSESFHPQLTMSMVIGACQGSEKTLGLGDYKGLEALY
jgi:hypothetical protein